MLSGQLMTIITARVSLDRFDAFLNGTELLDNFRQDDDLVPISTTNAPGEEEQIFFRNATFTWDSESSPKPVATASSKHEYSLWIDDLKIPQGKTTVIAGPTGCGKSSLLM